MLHLITTLTDNLLTYIKDDPVRPDIPAEFRVQPNRFVAAMVEDERPTSIVCVSLHDFVPESVQDLQRTVEQPDTAVFYTIWSYKPGSGANLLRTLVPRIREQFPSVTNFVTLSPKTDLARKFHLRNGAIVFRENPDTVNYLYLPA
jgi:hypothetical protein